MRVTKRGHEFGKKAKHGHHVFSGSFWVLGSFHIVHAWRNRIDLFLSATIVNVTTTTHQEGMAHDRSMAKQPDNQPLFWFAYLAVSQKS